jgi:hypothetical protein
VDGGVGSIDLSSALEALRGELETAWASGQGRRVRFRVTELTLTVEAVARREQGGGGKLRWWVLEAGAERRVARESTQTLVLTLAPSLYDDAGRSGPLDVAGDQVEPGD